MLRFLCWVQMHAVNLKFHFDQPKTWDRSPQFILVRGWCFTTDQTVIKGIRLHASSLCLSGTIRKFRPDVKAALPAASDDYTGFELSGKLPPGQLDISIEVQVKDGSWHRILACKTNVRRRWVPLWLGGGDWAELLFTQMPGGPKSQTVALKHERFPAARSSRIDWPSFSIVTPSFQQASYLTETMGSVLRQSSVRCDYYVQDGGSKDQSVELIRNLHEQMQQGRTTSSNSESNTVTDLTDDTVRFATWESVPDHGQADAIMRGFAKSSGGPDDLMAWLNADDFYLPGSLAFVADYFARHPDVDAIYGHRILVDETSREIGRWFLPAHDNEVLRLYDFVPQETLFWRRRIWDKIGGLDTSLKFAMDWDLLLRFEKAGARIARVPYFLACFRIHAAQKTSTQLSTVGQKEIDSLRSRTVGRDVSPVEIENSPSLRGYLRRSAWVELLWKLGIRAP